MRFVFSDARHPEIIEGMCRFAGPRIGWSFDPKRTTGIALLSDFGYATVLYTDWLPRVDVRMHIAAGGHWATRGALAVFFGYPFQELELRRVTAGIGKKRKDVRNFAERLGFKQEGRMRQSEPNRDDTIIYGLLAKDCRWLRERDNGKTESA